METEKAFAQGLEKRNDVKLYIKLPRWFEVTTPIGNYNPDWAIVMADPKTAKTGSIWCGRRKARLT